MTQCLYALISKTMSKMQDAKFELHTLVIRLIRKMEEFTQTFNLHPESDFEDGT